MYVCVEDPHRIDGFPHVVHAQDRGALPQALPPQGYGTREGLGGGGAEHTVDHRLAREPRQNGIAQRTEAVKPGEQFVILFRGLGEAETGVEDEMLACDPGGEQRGNPGLEIGDDLGRNVDL